MLPSSLEPFVRPRASFVPAYLETYSSGRLKEKVEESHEELRRCRVCPRNCDVDRLNDERALCKTGRNAIVASAFPHFGEEDCLRGWNGSGTIFFSNCNLRCVFCQNFDLSWKGDGQEMDASEIAILMISLQDQGCHNINFVTPEHVVPQVLEATYKAVQRGLRLPIVYNTGAYDAQRSLGWLEGVIDIFMPDFKFWNPQTSKRLVLAEDYAERAREAIRDMHRQAGDLVVDEDGLALRGLLVRHLVMPEGLAETREIMHFLAEKLSPDTYVNLMDQYSPAGLVFSRPEQYGDIDRRVTKIEMSEAVRIARAAGLQRLDSRWRSRCRPWRLLH